MLAELVLDARMVRNRVFLRKSLVVARRSGKKPGFFGLDAPMTVNILSDGLLLVGQFSVGTRHCRVLANFVGAVALSVCQTIESEGILANVQERGKQLRVGLRAIVSLKNTKG